MFLHGSFIYGPVMSRRLGSSLGINLLPIRRKVCNFECLYCECGWTDPSAKDPLPTPDQVMMELENRAGQVLRAGQRIDFFTFAGNGEPTLHPSFPEIIDRAIALRRARFPGVRIAVLSNAIRARHDRVMQALLQVDDAIMKLDAGTETMFQRIDRPEKGVTLDDITAALTRFEGRLIVQSMFLSGSFDGQPVDNTEEHEIEAWLERLHVIKPRKVMIYSIDREAPAKTVAPVAASWLAQLAERVTRSGIPAESY